MAKVLVVAEIKQGVLKSSTTELLSKARSLGAQTAVAAVGHHIESLIPELVGAGSDTQFIADDPGLELFSAAPYASCVVEAARQFDADMVWFGFSESGKAVIDLLMEFNAKNKQTLVIVTHDENIAQRSHKILHMKDGQLFNDSV